MPPTPPRGRRVVWIHAVSVGEVKAFSALFPCLRDALPGTFFFLTTTTETGQREASRLLPTLDGVGYLPWDFSWVVRRWVRRLAPTLALFVEGDLWPNLLHCLHGHGAKVMLISGKLSHRSAHYFRALSRCRIDFFAPIDRLCVQSEEEQERFLSCSIDPARICVTGNLKFDLDPEPVDRIFWEQRVPSAPLFMTLASTHAPEEEWLLQELLSVDGSLFLAPRHIERCGGIIRWLQEQQIPFVRWSALHDKKGGEKVVLIDVMGQLSICYTLSSLVVVGGSFVEHVGGHNVLEPTLYGAPVLFGPFTQRQKPLVQEVVNEGLGQEVTLGTLRSVVQERLSRQAVHSTRTPREKKSVERTLRECVTIFKNT